MSKSTGRRIAFFDFDGTLISSDSFILFAIFSKGYKKVFTTFLRFLPKIILMKFGFIDKDRLKSNIFSRLFRGVPADSFSEKCNNFVRIIDENINEVVLERVKALQEEGIETFIVSASVCDWIKPWAVINGFNGVIATEIELIADTNGNILLSGNFSTPNCNEDEKLNRVQQSFPGIGFMESWCYGDSAGDVPLLKMVSHPYYVKGSKIHPFNIKSP